MKFDVVIYIIGIRQAEAEATEVKRASAEKKQRILAILANKQDEALAAKSVEELEAIAASM